MGRQKKSSRIVTKAETRAAGLASIDPTLDLGNDLTLVSYKAKIAVAKTALDKYNSALALADTLQNKVQEVERDLASESTKMLAATGVKYGRDSSQYEAAGGRRLSDRKAPKKPADKAVVSA